MAGAVKSVEHFTLTISSGDRTDTTTDIGNLSLGQTLANCVPFVTKRASAVSGGEVEDYQVDVWFAATPNRVIAERDDTSGAVVVEIAVVEFDPARVNVYGGGEGSPGDDMAAGREGKWNLASGGSGLTKTIDLSAYPGGAITLDLAKSFLVFHSFQNSGTTTNWDSHLFRGRITGTQELEFDRAIGGGTADGHWYVIESVSGDFTVEAADIALASVASNTDTVTLAAADLDNSFLIGSWKGPDGGETFEDSTEVYTLDVALTENTVTATRVATTGTIDWSGFVVKTTDGTVVQRGNIPASDGSDDETLDPAVTVADSIASLSGSMGSTTGGSFPGTSISDVPDAMVTLTLIGSPTSTILRAEHNTGVGVVSWEVIEFGTGGGAPATRRVMVIS